MREEVVEAMSEEELKQYAEIIGADADAVENADTKEELARVCLERANRTFDVSAAGFRATIDMRSLSDMHMQKIAAKKEKTLDDLIEMSKIVLGDTQTMLLKKYVTDEDGSTDAVAFSFIIAQLLEQVNQKN